MWPFSSPQQGGMLCSSPQVKAEFTVTTKCCYFWNFGHKGQAVQRFKVTPGSVSKSMPQLAAKAFFSLLIRLGEVPLQRWRYSNQTKLFFCLAQTWSWLDCRLQPEHTVMCSKVWVKSLWNRDGPVEPGVQKTASAFRHLFTAPFLSISLSEILRFHVLAEPQSECLTGSCCQCTFVEEICSANPSNPPPKFVCPFPTYVMKFHIFDIEPLTWP